MGKGKGNAGRGGRGARVEPRRSGGALFGGSTGITSRDSASTAARKRRASRGGFAEPEGFHGTPRPKTRPKDVRSGAKSLARAASHAESRALARASASAAPRPPGRVARALGAIKSAFTRRRSG